ncbi:OmpA family protein [Geomobilimonas luticola]|uniref:OmpA family protein n=1 Tax=Geomobilimonas luticola TaxID=1114878 RepID=A0ABS5SD30_9BACT|nr:OmpA family protein [Geomobilimonas luticola]MBT0653263.1 OmpA family protein [Geomobilimonas luticola]
MALLILSLASPARALTPVQGDKIVSTVRVSSFELPPLYASATVTVVIRTTSTMEFLSYAPALSGAPLVDVATTAYRTGSDPGAPFVNLPAPVPVGSGTPVDLNKPVPLVAATVFHGGEPVFIRLTDLDQNLDRTARETVLVTLSDPTTGDTETLRLTETGPDTGMFVGYIPSAPAASAPYSGTLGVQQGSQIKGNYTDKDDGSDASSAGILVDPLGIVFNSQTGEPVNGATVTIINVATGEPATVYGDDGTSSFPATVTTGATTTDSSGRSYAFAPGSYRFPFVGPGTYTLQVAPPAGYIAPSTVADTTLQQLPGAPYALGTASRGETFVVNPGPALRIDVPVDPFATDLWVQKAAGKSTVAIGDFIPYEVSVQNTSAVAGAPGVSVTDRLPLGFRYQQGSAKINDMATSEPAISADGRTLTFPVGNLPAATTVRVRYVAAVSAGAVPGNAVNHAAAISSAGSTSNTATATVQVTSDFMSSRNLLMGRVFAGSCGDARATTGDKGLAGVRIYLEDGTFVDTDSRGMFHFEGVKPGTHVVQLDIDSLPDGYQVVPCEQNSRFAGRAFSQFVDLQGGTMWRVDFPVAVKASPVAEAPLEMVQQKGDVTLELTSTLQGATVGYRALLRGGPVAVGNLRLNVQLPEGAVYQGGSSRMDGTAIGDPAVNGTTLTYSLGNQSGDWKREIGFTAALPSPAKLGDLPTRATLTFDSPTAAGLATPPAETILRQVTDERRIPLSNFVLQPHFPVLSAKLTDDDKTQLDELARLMLVLRVTDIAVTGHTDNVRIAPRNRHIYRDNTALSFARAKSVGRYLMEALHLPPSSLTIEGKGESIPVADNGTEEGRALNRRVEIRVQAQRIIDMSRTEVAKGESGARSTPVAGIPAPAPQPVENRPPVAREPKEMQSDTAATDREGILSPDKGTVLINPINGVRASLMSQLTPRLLVDGKEVPADRIGYTMKDKKSGKTFYSYVGVDFGKRGEHTLQFQGMDPFGNARFNQTITVIRSGQVASLRLKSAEGNVADGKTPVRLQVELVDADGTPIPAAADLEIRSGTLKPVSREGELPEPKVGQFEQVHVDEKGTILFQPVNASGLYRVTLGYNNVKLETETYVKPLLRDWILVGLAEGTAGYNTVAGHMENFTSTGDEENFYDDGRLAFYAKGKIKGEWLLTAAYDTRKNTSTTGSNGLFQTIDPNAYYPLYGDASQQRYDAASSRKLYLKLERDQFYALFGDFDTDLTVTELSRYSRRMTGVKTEFQGRNIELNAFGSKTDQSYVKDELRGDGTSGMYHLTRTGIVENSDKIRIEVRDRFHGEIILKSRDMGRFTDYSIDYDTGTIFFKEPIANRDENFNPVFIVVEYETRSTGSESYTYGGRAGVKLLDQKLKAGFTYIHEGEVSGRGNSYGLDTAIKIGASTTLKGEMARTETSYGGLSRDGSAYLAELAHRSPLFDARIYFRELETGFGLGQQQASESGTRKMGAEAAYKLADRITLGGQAYRQENLASSLKRDVVEGKTAYSDGQYSASLGLRHASDQLADGTTNSSNQLTIGGSWLTLNKRLTLRAEHDQSIGSNSNTDFPTRTTFGADFKLIEAATLFAQQEFTSGATSKTNTTRVGVKATPWEGSTLNSTVEQDLGESSDRLFALFGLRQTVKLTDKWSVDGGVERSQTIKNTYTFKPDTPAVSAGGEDFTAVSVGTNYREKNWNWDGRVEVRSAKTEDRWGMTTSYVGEAKEGLALSSRLQLYNSNATTLTKTSGDLRFGLAYRPQLTRWIVLDRLDILYDRQRGGTFTMDNRRIVNNLNANFKPDGRTQISLQYGGKYVRETIDGRDYSGYTDLVGVEGRYDLTKDWDIGLRGSLLHTWSNGQFAYGTGASVGYNIVQNAWVSLGYNFAGFTDKDFSAADYTAQGPFVRFRFKFDQNSVKDAISWLNR